MKDKWLKFFRSQPELEIDQDRALQNKFNNLSMVYIEDKYMTFSDLNLVRAFRIINNYETYKNIRTSDRILSTISSKIATNTFDKSSNTLFELFRAYESKHDLIYQDPVLDSFNYLPSKYVHK